jgi:hypothetical protein
MPLSEYRNAYSWQEAINLGPGLIRLAEELPASEQMGLAWQLQQSMIELPASIAFDLLKDNSDTSRMAALRLVAALELIEKIYPALDASEVREELDNLINRIKSDNFTEETGATSRIPAETTSHAAPAPATPAAPAASVPVIPEPAAAPEVAAPHEAHSVQVEVQPSESSPAPEEDHVQPDSVQ